MSHKIADSLECSAFASTVKRSVWSLLTKFNHGKSGQAATKSPIGSFLYDLARREDVKLVLEIGTWNGRGSTYCIALGLSQSEGKLISIEANKAMYQAAVRFYRYKKLPVELIHGSSVSPAQFPPLSDFEKISDNVPNREQWSQWYQNDLEAARQSQHPGVLDELISQYGMFDMIYLDGGEFTSYAEYLKVCDLTRYIVLDDCNPTMVVKNVWSRNALLQSADWRVLVDELGDRNGWCAFERVGS